MERLMLERNPIMRGDSGTSNEIQSDNTEQVMEDILEEKYRTLQNEIEEEIRADREANESEE